MPWVNKEMCTGCGICIDECTVGVFQWMRTLRL